MTFERVLPAFANIGKIFGTEFAKFLPSAYGASEKRTRRVAHSQAQRIDERVSEDSYVFEAPL